MAGIDLTVWGIPALVAHNTERFPSGSPGAPSGCPGELGTGCIVGPPFPEAGLVQKPFIDNPSDCTGEPLPVHLSVRTYQDPANVSSRETDLPPDQRLRTSALRSGPENRPDQPRSRLAFGTRRLGRRRPVPRCVAGAVLDPVRLPGPAGRLLDQPRRRRRADRLLRRPGRLRYGRPEHLPRQLEDRHGRSDHPGPGRPADRLPLHRRTAAERAVPGLHDLRRLRPLREDRRRLPSGPDDRAADPLGTVATAGPVRTVQPAPLRLRPRPDRHRDPLQRSTP